MGPRGLGWQLGAHQLVGTWAAVQPFGALKTMVLAECYYRGVLSATATQNWRPEGTMPMITLCWSVYPCFLWNKPT